ncbi:hypothetical protein [Nocardia africana]
MKLTVEYVANWTQRPVNATPSGHYDLRIGGYWGQAWCDTDTQIPPTGTLVYTGDDGEEIKLPEITAHLDGLNWIWSVIEQAIDRHFAGRVRASRVGG